MALRVGTIASPLGDWTFARYAPEAHDAFGTSLQGAWYFDGVLAHARERVFPKGTHGLVIQLEEPHRAADGSPYPAVVYNGMGTRAIVVEAPAGRTRVIGLELRATAGFALAHGSVCVAVNEAVDFREFAGPQCEALIEACRRERTPAGILLCAMRWIARRVAQVEACTTSVSEAIARIEHSRGRVRMRDLAAEIGRGERALERAFRDRVGISPKRYARIARFSYAHELLVAEHAFAEIAGLAGYYDQAHFNTDFREHAGLSPSHYLRALRYPGSRSLVEPG